MYHAIFSEQAKSSCIVIIAATNRLLDLDEAVVRRFESKIYVGVPNKKTRKCLIEKFMKDIEHNLTLEDIDRVCEICIGWSGSDIEMICREAAMVGRHKLCYHLFFPK